ncbi:pyridoxamine kinase [Clostridium sp.]|uniref:pyridoxamine kinase n=1 Tax=Clostridium sp. TaxID=1506 RepID=UPI002624A8E2|nr:pyridoxamine kinase [Clostridium sp.]
MKKPIKRVLTIHDLCGIGKAALTNIIPVLATLGIEACPIPTMILTTHTGGFKPSVIKLDGYISKAFDHYKDIAIDFEGVFVGYLGTNEMVDETLKLLSNKRGDNSLIVFDPIFADNGKYYSNFNKCYSETLKKLISYSDVITPNYSEACFLVGENIKSEIEEDELLIICRKLHNLGTENVVITSIPMINMSKIGTAVYDGKKDLLKIIIADKLEKSYPGTGDVFTSVLISMLLKEISLVESVKKACEFVEKCIIESSKYDYPGKEGLLLEAALKYLCNI